MPPMSAVIRQHVTLPTGVQASMWISLDFVVLRVNGQTCCAHRGWMTDDQLTELAAALAEAARMEDGTQD